MEWRETGGVRFLAHDLDRSSVSFGSRVGGVSSPPFASLNAGIGTGDNPVSVTRNRIALSEAVGVEAESVVMARQVHGDALAEHQAAAGKCSGHWIGGTVPEEEADGHIVDRPGVGLAILTADCLPIAIEGSRGLALVHCGWRGLVAGIAAKAARLVRGEYAAIGPGIGPCCYEVGEDVLDQFPTDTPGSGFRRLDLVSAARAQLAGEGVARIEGSGICTSCSVEEFFSHRRNGPVTGRQATVAWLN